MTDTKKFKAKCTAVVSPIEKEEFQKFFENLYGSTRASHLSFQVDEKIKYTRPYEGTEEFKRFEISTSISAKNFKGEDLYNLLKKPSTLNPIHTFIPIPEKYSVDEIQFSIFYGEEKGKKFHTPVETFGLTTVPGWLPYTPQGRGVIEGKIGELQDRLNGETKTGWDWQGSIVQIHLDLLLNPDRENMPELDLSATFSGEGRENEESKISLYLSTTGEFDIASPADNNYNLIQHQNSVKAAGLLEDRLGRWLDITGRIKPETVNFN